MIRALIPDGLLWAVSLVMVASGAMKLADPSATGDTLRQLGLPGGPGPARLIGVAEVVLGLAVLAVGGWIPAVLVGLMYVAFAAIVIAARAKGLPSCGCFGSRSSPPSVRHVVVDVASAAVAFVAALRCPPLAVADGLDSVSTAAAIGTVVVVLVLAIGLIVADTTGPEPRR